MRLGALAVKLAQVNVAALLENSARHGATPSNVAFNAGERAAPVTTSGGLAIQALQSVFGDAFSGAALLLPFVAGPLQTLGIDLTQLLRLGYGGSDSATQEAMGPRGAQTALMNTQLRENSQLVKRMAGYAASLVSKLPPFVQAFLPKDPEQWTAQITSKIDDNTLGQWVTTLGQIFPDALGLMTQLDPSFITDATPFVKQTLLQNNGKFDPDIFDRNIAAFKDVYNRGWFGQVPAQLAANAVQHTREKLGSRATLGNAAMASAVADSLVKAGFATFGDALEMASQIGGRDYFTNPTRLISTINRISEMAAAGNVSPQQVAQAATVALKQGQNPLAYMQLVATSGQASGRLGSQLADKITPGAVQTQQSMMQEYDLLGEAVSKDVRYKRMFERAVKSGRPDAVAELLQRAKSDQRLLRSVGTDGPTPGLGSQLFSQMSMHNPDFVPALMVQQTQQQMRDLDPKAYRGMQRMLGSQRGRSRLGEMLVSGDFTGVRDRRLRAALADNQSLVGNALSINPELLRRNRFGLRNQRLRRIPDADLAPEPTVPRIGLPGPVPAEQQPPVVAQ